ncbi:MAG: lysophospholipid acyltransferase family protein [Bacillota bacterium]|nr:lysophospholipid acyltransferase family protein [Bacillota bacterium]
MKLLWYGYFGVYLAFNSLSLIKVERLKKKDEKKAAEYAFKKVQKIARHVLKASNTKLEVYGKENIPEEACLFVGNHQAIFDAFAMIPAVDKVTGFIAKTEIEKLPLIPNWLRSIKTVFLDRDNVKESIRVINQGAENIKNGYSMVIFPEGTRSLSSTMGTMKKGSLKVALKASAPIVPFSIDGTYRVLEVGKKVTGHTIKIMFHKPIYVSSLPKEEQKDLTERVQEIVRAGLKQLTEENN